VSAGHRTGLIVAASTATGSSPSRPSNEERAVPSAVLAGAERDVVGHVARREQPGAGGRHLGADGLDPFRSSGIEAMRPAAVSARSATQRLCEVERL
jgi:hypothetical protein